MFSIECCTALFVVSNLWRSFVCATIVKIVYSLLVANTSSDLNTFLVMDMPKFGQIILDGCFIGIICGWLGALWIYLFCKLQIWRKNTRFTWVNNRYVWVPLVAIIISLNTYWLPNVKVGPKPLLGQLFYMFRLGDKPEIWTDEAVFSTIFLTFITRYFNCLLFATCRLPNGVFLPSLIIGALFGRMYGQFLQ